MRFLTVILPPHPSLPPAQWVQAELWADLAFQLREGATLGSVTTLVQSGHAAPEALPEADHLTLIVPACDVRLLPVQLPPMSANKLKQALPHAVEDALLQDPTQCHLAVSEPQENGWRTVAVIDKAWLRAILDRFQAPNQAAVRRYAKLRVLPGQLCLPWPPTPESLAEGKQACGSETLLPATAHSPATLLRTVRDGAVSGYGLRLVVPAEPQHAVAWPAEVAVVPTPTAMPAADTLNLCQFEFASAAQSHVWLSWQTWRWPLRLALALLVGQWLVLQSQAWQMGREAKQIQQEMADTLHSVLPEEPVVDAPLQLRRHVEQLRSAGGKLSQDDFNVLAERLATLLQGQAPDLLQSLQYQQRSLLVTFKAGANTSALTEQAAQLGLRMQAESSSSGVGGGTAGNGSRWRISAAQ